ncbi:MAG: EpsI family protein [Puniceicoccales bacterium]|jgi:hypothetical protein|nr:EpsI family protein [Puniceicoccales bacterium]
MQRKFLISCGVTLGLVVALILYIALFTTSRSLVVCPVEVAGGVCPLKGIDGDESSRRACPVGHYLPKGATHTPLPQKGQEGLPAAHDGGTRKNVPGGLEGWESQDVPLSDSEVLNSLIDSALAFDSYAYRFYKKGDCEVAIYVAYWGPGKVSTTDAGVHNPDSCWINAGWRHGKRVHSGEYFAGGRKLKPLEYGIYERQGEGREKGRTLRMPVLFWHLVGGEINPYQTEQEGYRSGIKGRLERLPLFWEDLKRYGLNQRREQMFVRITFTRPIEEMLKMPDFVLLLKSIAPLAIFEGDSWESLSTAAK